MILVTAVAPQHLSKTDVDGWGSKNHLRFSNISPKTRTHIFCQRTFGIIKDLNVSIYFDGSFSIPSRSEPQWIRTSLACATEVCVVLLLLLVEAAGWGPFRRRRRSPPSPIQVCNDVVKENQMAIPRGFLGESVAVQGSKA